MSVGVRVATAICVASHFFRSLLSRDGAAAVELVQRELATLRVELIQAEQLLRRSNVVLDACVSTESYRSEVFRFAVLITGEIVLIFAVWLLFRCIQKQKSVTEPIASDSSDSDSDHPKGSVEVSAVELSKLVGGESGRQFQKGGRSELIVGSPVKTEVVESSRTGPLRPSDLRRLQWRS